MGKRVISFFGALSLVFAVTVLSGCGQEKGASRVPGRRLKPIALQDFTNRVYAFSYSCNWHTKLVAVRFDYLENFGLFLAPRRVGELRGTVDRFGIARLTNPAYPGLSALVLTKAGTGCTDEADISARYKRGTIDAFALMKYQRSFVTSISHDRSGVAKVFGAGTPRAKMNDATAPKHLSVFLHRKIIDGGRHRYFELVETKLFPQGTETLVYRGPVTGATKLDVDAVSYRSDRTAKTESEQLDAKASFDETKKELTVEFSDAGATKGFVAKY